MARRFRYNPATDKVEEVGIEPRGTNDWKQLSCEAMGFDGTLEDAQRIDRECGAPYVDYQRVGPEAYNPVFNDKGTYQKYLKAHGMVNKTSGKSGASPLNSELLKRAMERIKANGDEA